MENPGDFMTPRASIRRAPASLPGDADRDDDSLDDEGASSSTIGSPRLQVDKLIDDCGMAPKASAIWSPASQATTARSPSISGTAWSARSSISDSPITGTLRIPKPFAPLDPEIAACLSKPLLDASDTVGRTYWEGFFVVLPMYSGYAALFGLQHHIKMFFGIQDDSSTASYDFSAAVSCLYVWSFAARIGHSAIFSCITPRARVFVSMVSMLLALAVLSLVFICLRSHMMYWVILAYSLGGIGIGSFESNFLSCLTPLGHATKHIAIIGIPTGVTLVNVGGFFLMGPPWHISPAIIYLVVAIWICCGMLLVSVRIPNNPVDQCVNGRENGLVKLWADAREFRSWLPNLWHYAVAFTVDMLALSAFCPGVILYVYDKATVTLFPGMILPTSTFLALVNTFSMLGGVAGRWLSYRVKPRHPAYYSVLTCVGIFVLLIWVPLIAPLGTFLVMMGDGLIYGSISKHIDSGIPRQFNLTVISLWLLFGDVGSIIGSNMIYPIKCWSVGH